MSKIVIANFKSNKNREEYEIWMEQFEKHDHSISPETTVVLAPPSVDLMFFSNRLLDKGKHNVKLAVQDISPFPAGAYTGAVGTKNLEGFGISYAIVGHSERRQYFHETDNDIANKVRESLASNIKPIVCVTKNTVLSQANAIEDQDRRHVIVAFEPVENIGTGVADSLRDILKTKELVTRGFGNVPYVYGGSVDPNTDTNILKHSDIDGFLVGSASLHVDIFIKLLNTIR